MFVRILAQVGNHNNHASFGVCRKGTKCRLRRVTLLVLVYQLSDVHEPCFAFWQDSTLAERMKS